MGSQSVRSEVIEALRRYGFYIFDKSKQDQVREILKLIGDLRSLVKVRGLPNNPSYFILEVDTYTFEAACRERCGKNGVIDPHCYSKCVAESNRNIIDRVTAVLLREIQ